MKKKVLMERGFGGNWFSSRVTTVTPTVMFHFSKLSNYLAPHHTSPLIITDRWKDRKMDYNLNGCADRLTDRQADRQGDKQTNRQINGHLDRQTD